MHVQPYLIFPGTCRDALEFYAETLGGTIEHVQTVAESHLPAAPEHGDRVFHSVFVAGDLRFMASDGEPGKDPQVGHNFAMFLTCDDDEQQGRIFSTLQEGGRVMVPLDGGFGMLEDRFGIRWMIGLGTS
jgi:PhnB protein